jgi:two-component system, NtrC family, sensor kinase
LIPIRTDADKTGVIVCYYMNEAHTWSTGEIELLQAVGDQLAIAINQANLYTQSCIQSQQLVTTLDQLKRTQAQIIQAEKMSSLGQMVAGVAHEINNPVNFIHGNLQPAQEYADDLLGIIELYRTTYPEPTPEIVAELESVDLEFVQEDLPKLLNSMVIGTERIREIVLSLRNFSRLDEAAVKTVHLHEGLDSTLVILNHRLKATESNRSIEVIKRYGELPQIDCYPSQLNQVFMNVLANAIDALDQQPQPTLTITTEIQGEPTDPAAIAIIRIADNGPGIPADIQPHILDPFFTTKPVGKGTGMGMSISYQIITEKHGGELTFTSEVGKGTEFVIKIPVYQPEAT